MAKVLKLYVWDGAFPDWSGGCAFALAYDVRQARRLIIAKAYDRAEAKREVAGRPSVFRAPAGFIVRGGG